jgi:hypothetical protein
MQARSKEILLRAPRLTLCTIATLLALAVAPAHAAAAHSKSSGKETGTLVGFGAGELLPQGAFADFNDPSYFIQSRTLIVKKIFGGRVGAYYGDTGGANGADGGRVYGVDFDFLVKAGGADTFAYFFAGAGYGTLTYTTAGLTPGSSVRVGGHDWCWTGGVGVTIKHGFYLEASYVSYQTNPEATSFIPVVIGFQY